MAVALPKPQLGGFLLEKIRNVNKHEEQTFFHWFSAIAEVAQLDHVRVYIRKLGTAAKAVANRRKLAIEFTGSAFEPDAVAFFGPVRDGDDVEKALGKYYLHLKSQKAIVDYANSTGMEPQWVFETRKDQLADSRELMPGFKRDCPDLVDEEGNIMYTDPSFVEAFAEAMVERHAGMKQKGDIHDFTVKMRKRRVRLEKWAKHILKKKKVYYIELWRRHAAQDSLAPHSHTLGKHAGRRPLRDAQRARHAEKRQDVRLLRLRHRPLHAAWRVRGTDGRAERIGNAFQHQQARTGRLQQGRIVADAAGRSLIAPLHLVAAERVDRLRGQADMRHHRHAADIGHFIFVDYFKRLASIPFIHENQRATGQCCRMRYAIIGRHMK